MITGGIIGQVKDLTSSKELHFLDREHNFRYERKFTVPNELSLNTIEQFIKRNNELL